MATPITSVSGIGAQTAEILVKNGFENAEALAAAKEDDLLKISGFGPSKAKKFIEAAQTLVGTTVVALDGDEPDLAEVEVAEEVKAEAEKLSGPKIVTQKLCKKKKKKSKSKKTLKKKKKSSRKKKSK